MFNADFTMTFRLSVLGLRWNHTEPHSELESSNKRSKWGWFPFSERTTYTLSIRILPREESAKDPAVSVIHSNDARQ